VRPRAAKLKQATKSVAEKVLDRTGDFASTKVLAWSRGSLNATLGRFFGDVFIYMDGRKDQASPGDIPKFLLGEWDKAIAATPNEPTVIIGHSLGGVISYDLLSYFRPDLNVDLFVSIGSQVSHFEEMKLFKASRTEIPGPAGDQAPKPDNIKHWINVFDEVDIFSYSCKAIFKDVHDYPYDTKTYVVKAHGAYFEQARFYERLRARIDKLPVV
jgi:pimeloyl-ACP methyl ester carboxylesterase